MRVKGVLKIPEDVKTFPSIENIILNVVGLAVLIEHNPHKEIGHVIKATRSSYTNNRVIIVMKINKLINFMNYSEIGISYDILMSRLSLSRGMTIERINIKELSVMKQNCYPGNYILGIEMDH